MRRKVIISYSLAKDLIRNGFRVIDIEPNNKDSKRTIFIFENTEALTTYLQHKRGNNIYDNKHNRIKEQESIVHSCT